MHQILQHSATARHKQIALTRFSSTQSHFEIVRPQSNTSELSNNPSTSRGTETSNASSGKIALDSCLDDKVTKAEVLWAMKTAHGNYSSSSSDATPSLFREMMPCSVSEKFTMSHTKVSYLIKDGLGLYYLQQLSADVKSSDGYFTLQFDETVNSQVRKQCDLLVRYWSEKDGTVAVRFLQALFLDMQGGGWLQKEFWTL